MARRASGSLSQSIEADMQPEDMALGRIAGASVAVFGCTVYCL